MLIPPDMQQSHFYGGAITEMAPETWLAKTGTGTQVLDGANTHTGPTTIREGVLALGAAGSLDHSAILRIAPGAVLDTSAQETHARSSRAWCSPSARSTQTTAGTPRP